MPINYGGGPEGLPFEFRKSPAERVAEKRKKRREQGLCLQCGVECGAAYCDDCKDKRNKNTSAKHAAFKARCVDLMGGACQHCGFKTEYHEVYDFHHVDESTKEETIAKLCNSRSWEAIEAELKKCVMLCANCHRIHHAIKDHLANSD